MSLPSSSSTNSGFPSEARLIWARTSVGSSARPSRPPTSSSLSSSDSASSWMVVTHFFPPPQAGRFSSRSGRAMATSRIGASRVQSAM